MRGKECHPAMHAACLVHDFKLPIMVCYPREFVRTVAKVGELPGALDDTVKRITVNYT